MICESYNKFNQVCEWSPIGLKIKRIDQSKHSKWTAVSVVVNLYSAALTVLVTGCLYNLQNHMQKQAILQVPRDRSPAQPRPAQPRVAQQDKHWVGSKHSMFTSVWSVLPLRPSLSAFFYSVVSGKFECDLSGFCGMDIHRAKRARFIVLSLAVFDL